MFTASLNVVPHKQHTMLLVRNAILKLSENMSLFSRVVSRVKVFQSMILLEMQAGHTMTNVLPVASTVYKLYGTGVLNYV